jgi:hypothetical protein
VTPVVLDGLAEGQRQSWLGLLEVARVHPDGWCLVGGQMVYLLCRERSFAPVRLTNDSDLALDGRAHPNVLHDFTAALVSVGFVPAGESPEGHQHRWVRDLASIDLLIPQDVGGAAASRRGVSGGTTLQTPGAQQAITRSEPVAVQVGGTGGTVRRPNMLGALVAKAVAYSVWNDQARHRHLSDFAVLAAMARRADRLAEQMNARDRRYLAPALLALSQSRPLWAGIEGADRAVEALQRLIASAPDGAASPGPVGASPGVAPIDL